MQSEVFSAYPSAREIGGFGGIVNAKEQAKYGSNAHVRITAVKVCNWHALRIVFIWSGWKR